MVYPWKVPPPVANQIDLFMHFLGASRDGLVARPVEMDTIPSSARLTLRGPYCVVTKGSVMARHRHDVGIDNLVFYFIGYRCLKPELIAQPTWTL